MSDSVRPHRRQPTRLSRPWDSPSKNTGVGCHFLLQCMKVKSESEVAQSCPTLATPWTAAYQAPPSMGFSRQEYWSGVPSPSLIHKWRQGPNVTTGRVYATSISWGGLHHWAVWYVEGTAVVWCLGLILLSQGLGMAAAGGGRGSDSCWGTFCDEVK